MLDVSRARDRMVDVHIARRGVRDSQVLDAMRRIPRETFVEPGFEEFAYEDGPLPIGEGQTISQPYIVALMIEAAEVEPGDRVLEVGAGSGYAAAVMSRIAERVHAIERHPALADAARRAVRRARLQQRRAPRRRRDDGLAGRRAVRRHSGGCGRARGAAGAEGAACGRRPAGDPGRWEGSRTRTLLKVTRSGEDGL